MILRHLQALLLLTIFIPQAVAAPPQASYLYPAGVQQGESVTLRIGGSFSNWPSQAWASHSGLTVEPLEKKEQVEVTVADETPPGIYWLRFYDHEGCTSPRPFVVGTLSELLEVEPNDDPLKPQPVGQSSVVNGRLEKRDEVDTYSIELTAGQTLIASLAANSRLASPMDAVLQICDAQGFVLAQNNDAHGLDPQLVFAAPAAGTYLVRTFAFPSQPSSTIGFAGGDDYVYRLTLTTAGFLQRTMPLAVPRGEATSVDLIGWNFEPFPIPLDPEDNDTHVVAFHADLAETFRLPVVDRPVVIADQQAADAAQAISLPVDLSGCLTKPAESHAFRFTAEKNQQLQFQVVSRSLGFPLDAVLQLVDPNTGEQLAEVDDTNKQPDAELTHTFKAAGEYEIRLHDLHDRGGERFAYRLIAQPVTASFSLSVAKHAFMLKPGESVELPLKIERENGHAAEIDITAIDLPAGVTAEKVTSSGKGDSSKEVKLKLTAADDAQSGSFRIRGSTDEGSASRMATFTPEGFSEKLAHVWLTVGRP